jgi:hypothetical protein
MADAATEAVVAVAPYVNGEVATTCASRCSASVLQALPTAPDDRPRTCAMARGVMAVPVLSCRTLATIARSSPLRNRDAGPPAGTAGTVAGAGVVVVIAMSFRGSFVEFVGY